MNKKWFGLFIIIAAIIIIISIVYFVFLYRWGGTTEIPEEPIDNSPSITLPINSGTNATATPVTIPAVALKATTGEDLKRLAASFAERLGSYSNQSNYENISELKVFMTPSMQEWADKFIAEKKLEKSSEYSGVNTSAIISEVKSFDDAVGKAEILIKTQRRESTGTMENAKVYYQDIIISYVKEQGEWKVDNALWQKQ